MAIVHAAFLGAWLIRPSVLWTAAVVVSALLTLALALLAPRRIRALLVALAAAAGAWSAVATSRLVSQIERNWETDSTGVRWHLVEAAGAALNGEIDAAVSLAEQLAETGANLGGASRNASFARLRKQIGGDGPERGVVVFDTTGRPWAWAGRHRLLPASPAVGLDARITPFYATLDAWRQGPAGALAVAHVVLFADSAVPDRDRTLEYRFARATGVNLEFYPPGRGPYWADVFDYCLFSACSDTTVVPDTLFSVRMVPPTQGAYKLAVMADGARRVAVLGGTLLLLVTVLGGLWTRVAGIALAGLLVLTPAGAHLRLGTLFSPATYFSDLLGPLTASSGALLATASVGLVLAMALWRRGLRVTPLNYVGAAILMVAGPSLLRVLAAGITPPVEGSDLLLWMQWEVPVTVAMAALLLLAAALIRGDGTALAPRWMAALAGLWAAGAAMLGLIIWQPAGGWPVWYLYLWLPAFGLAIQPAAAVRTVATAAVVAGTAAALLTWGAAADGRLLLAERDMAGLRQRGDPVAVGLLERFGARMQEEGVPRDAAALYSRWSRSTLHADRYPAVLITWSPGGSVRARLDLAELDDEQLPIRVLQEFALEAVDRHVPAVGAVFRAPGTHYVLTVPFLDGSVVTVGLAPNSRVVRPARVALFLRGERVLTPPYEMTISEPVLGAQVDSSRLTWRRDGWSVRGEEQLEFPDGGRHVHVTVALGGFPSLSVRGTLVTVLDVALILLLWLAGEAIAGTLRAGPFLRMVFTRRSYRARLGVAFALFFIIPTVGFAAWTAGRLAGEAGRSRDIMIRQSLIDAAGTARDWIGRSGLLVQEELRDLGDRLGADLVLYEAGTLHDVSTPVLAELGLLDRYLDPAVFEAFATDEIEVIADKQMAGRATRVGYRNIGGLPSGAAVLATLRLVEDPVLIRSEQDLVFGLVLVTLFGIAAAAGLATLAAESLAKPVQALRQAADEVGRGEMPSPFAGDAPGEFAPVMEAFERMASDVSATRAALEAQRSRTAAVLRNVATGVVALDERLQVTMANPRAEQLLARQLGVGRSIVELAPAGWQPVWEWVQAALRERREAEPREFTIDERQIRVQVAPLSGWVRGCVVALDDTTDLTQAVRVLAWGELARQVAHEIKNPLTPIRLGIQHLRRAYDSPRGKYHEILERTSAQMLAEIERLDAIARAFARFGAPTAEAGPLTTFDLVEVARDTAALYTMGDGEQVRVEADRPVEGTARPDEFKEVLINLIENARTAGATTVTIALASSSSRAEIRVHDDGAGIPHEDVPKIFEPQFSTTTSGTGLGLAICKRLVESWGGEIVVESEPGAGTTVIIECPCAPGFAHA